MKPLKLTLVLASLLAFTFAPALAATLAWTGGGDEVSWSDRFNWSGDQVPGPTNDVVIISVASNLTVTRSANVTIKSL